jgi:hypothetical protein
MSYKPDEPIDELIKRKEYAQLRLNKLAISEMQKDSKVDQAIIKENKLVLQTYQKIPKTWLNPNNFNTRLLMKFVTGAGKTISSIEVAMEFIQQFMDNYRISDKVDRTPEVFIIGFSRRIFIKEFMKRPEFGFVTREEILKEAQMRANAVNGSNFDRDELARFHSEVKKRFSKKSIGGLIKFYGYKEFFNRLFIFTLDGLAMLAENLGVDGLDRSNLTEDQLLIGLREGFITLNKDLVDIMCNSLMIFDEFHNVYNSSEINNYGIAIRVMLMIHDKPYLMHELCGIEVTDRLRGSLLRALFLTATPINNSPTEIIDLLNMLVRLDRIQEYYKNTGDKDWKKRIRLDKSDFFEDTRNLKRGALGQIANLVNGCVSYLADTNPAYFPTYEFVGETIKIPKSLLGRRLHGYREFVIPYLKFIRCPMSPLHLKTYKAVFTGTLPPDGQMLLDMILPDPAGSGIGIFKTRDIKQALRAAGAAWKARYGIDIETQTVGSNQKTDVLVGSLFEEKSLATYSSKYHKLLTNLIDNLKNDGGKGIINHQFVRMSGTLCIDEILRRNGILDEYSEPLDNTRCSKCGIARIKHKNHNHDFIPTRFIMLHSDIDKSVQERSIEKFKSADNIFGYNYRWILGSKIINESMDFSEVQEIELTSAPDNYATLLQLIGRGIRKNSHIRLPPEKRHVKIRIYTHTMPGSNDLSYEERRYLEKGMDYLVIQQIERIFNSEAIDAPLSRDIIFPPGANDPAGLGQLPFNISESFGPFWKQVVAHKHIITDRDLNKSTWNVFFAREEIELMIYIIKRLFLEFSTVWTYDDLWSRLRLPPFMVGVNTELFDEECFVIALEYLTRSDNGGAIASHHWLDSLFNPEDIVINGSNKIVWLKPYYMLVPLRFTDEPTQLGINQASSIPEIDIDSWYRSSATNRSMTLDITKQLQTSSASYDQLKMRFYKKFHNLPISSFPLGMEIYGIDFHIRLVQDAIKYCFNIMVDPNMQFSELHSFYFKLLWFYDRFDLILYASDLDGSNLQNIYKPYITNTNIKYGIHGRKINKTLKPSEFKGVNRLNAFLQQSRAKSAGLSKPINLEKLNEFLGRTKTPAAARSLARDGKRVERDPAWREPNRKVINKVFANLLPVGHFLNTNEFIHTVSIPIMYNPDFKNVIGSKEWEPKNEFASTVISGTTKENDLLIGYYDKNINSVELKFKLRQPVHLIERHDDSRMQERGSACGTRKKEELHEIMKKLGIKEHEDNIRSMCDNIKLELMKREILEHKKPVGQRVKWFYFHFENHLS